MHPQASAWPSNRHPVLLCAATDCDTAATRFTCAGLAHSLGLPTCQLCLLQLVTHDHPCCCRHTHSSSSGASFLEKPEECSLHELHARVLAQLAPMCCCSAYVLLYTARCCTVLARSLHSSVNIRWVRCDDAWAHGCCACWLMHSVKQPDWILVSESAQYKPEAVCCTMGTAICVGSLGEGGMVGRCTLSCTSCCVWSVLMACQECSRVRVHLCSAAPAPSHHVG